MSRRARSNLSRLGTPGNRSQIPGQTAICRQNGRADLGPGPTFAHAFEAISYGSLAVTVAVIVIFRYLWRRKKPLQEP